MTADAKDGDESGKEPPRPSYDEERQEIRQHEVARILSTTKAVDAPTAVFTGGQPGAGKSRSIVQPLEDQYDSKGGIGVIDPDAIRPLFAQAQHEIAKGGEFSPEAYSASGTVAYEISIDCSHHQRNLLRDGTLGDMTYPKQEMAELRTQHYRVEAHIAAVYEELSFARTVVRAEQERATSPDGFGRGVGREFHDNSVSGVAASAGLMWNTAIVDRLVLYESDGRAFFEGVREGGKLGKWVDGAGQPHTVGPKEQLEDRQHNPRPRDLVDAATTWLAARSLIEDPERKTPASAESIAVVSKESALAFNKVLTSPEAMQLVGSNKPLREALKSHSDRPLEAAAQAWRKNPSEAAKQWPEHKAAFALAEHAAKAVAAAKPDQERTARDHMADKLARGQMKPEPVKARAPERAAPEPKTPPRSKERDGPER